MVRMVFYCRATRLITAGSSCRRFHPDVAPGMHAITPSNKYRVEWTTRNLKRCTTIEVETLKTKHCDAKCKSWISSMKSRGDVVVGKVYAGIQPTKDSTIHLDFTFRGFVPQCNRAYSLKVRRRNPDPDACRSGSLPRWARQCVVS